MRTKHHSNGFTLIELMIVGIGIAIFLIMHSPAYKLEIAKQKRPDAVAGLQQLQKIQELFREKCPRYASNVTSSVEICDPEKGYQLHHEALSPDGHYSLSIIHPTTRSSEREMRETYTLLAVPLEQDIHCASFTLDQDGNKNATHNDCL
ncbi:MAG: hypothetical protein KAG10_08635 [Methylococcales bacterium]|nr:hypothetical protein [Methylococcales bacterium]MCK5925944.1 hypothetical protein [Methylococcales bacterium]